MLHLPAKITFPGTGGEIEARTRRRQMHTSLAAERGVEATIAHDRRKLFLR